MRAEPIRAVRAPTRARVGAAIAVPEVATELTETFVGSVAGVQLSNAADVDRYFHDRFQQPFLDWYRGAINPAQPVDAAVKERFAAFWDRLPTVFGGPIRLLQFLTLQHVFVKEGAADMRPRGERTGSAGHPGIAYLFDAIPGIKKSYNRDAANRPAGDLFNDAQFIEAHGELPLGDVLRHTTDPVWNGDRYPQESQPTSDDPTQTGFVLQADFSKFRGRGLIQTTFRENYVRLVRLVQDYADNQPVVLEYKQAWTDHAPDVVATRSRLEDWKRLFEETEQEVAAHAIRIHNETHQRYLDLGSTAAALNAGGQHGSIYFVGLRINGGTGYAADLKARVVRTCNALGN